MMSGRAAVAADRLTALDDRLNELAQRLMRISAGEGSSAADVERARARAFAQRARALEAGALLDRCRQAGPQPERASVTERVDPDPGPRARCIEAARTRPTPDRYWRIVVDQARRANWQNWTDALCVAAVAVLPSVRGVAVSAFADQLPCPLGASDRRTSRMEALQQVLGEGPAVTAQRNREPVAARVPETAKADWLGWARSMLDSGVQAVWSFPHRWPGIGCAAVTFYRGTDADAPAERAEAQSLSRLAGKALQLDLERNNSAGLDALQAIHVAAGVLAERLDLSAADALARLRARAFAQSLDLTDVAASVVRDGARLD